MNNNKENKFIISSLITTLLLSILAFLLSVMIPRVNYNKVDDYIELNSTYGLVSNVVIKAEFNNIEVKGIGVRALSSKKIKEVSFEENSNVEYIERRAFYGSSIKSITIPNSVKNIYQNCFSYSLLEKVEFESGSKVEAISGSMFFECQNLSSVNIPNSVKSIGTFAFYNCKNLKSLYIPSGCKIYKDAFYGCDLVIYCSDTSNFQEGFDNNANIIIKSVA